ncbi:hypothetical protein FRX31_032498 [Thalictrum thalictroides]|uniref:Uncharacterized protein n=1 Tax=Thalictrum thalictroides TaxID=46969 RepID=A0A7J6V0Z4_THATH|nr:hypothetical protein FRX31_032498 [Thalictrum thalictroides]
MHVYIKNGLGPNNTLIVYFKFKDNDLDEHNVGFHKRHINSKANIQLILKPLQWRLISWKHDILPLDMVLVIEFWNVSRYIPPPRGMKARTDGET